MTLYANDMASLKGEVVTQGHADYCAAHGHATHTVDGVDSGVCPRCGDVADPAWTYYVQSMTGAVHTSQNCSVVQHSTRVMPHPVVVAESVMVADIEDPNSRSKWCKRCQK